MFQCYLFACVSKLLLLLQWPFVCFFHYFLVAPVKLLKIHSVLGMETNFPFSTFVVVGNEQKFHTATKNRWTYLEAKLKRLDKCFRLMCDCEHNTCGEQCNICCPGFIQKKWSRAIIDQPFVCERKSSLFHQTKLEIRLLGFQCLLGPPSSVCLEQL